MNTSIALKANADGRPKACPSSTGEPLAMTTNNRPAAVALTRLGASELAGMIARREVSSLQVVEAHIQRIAQVNTKLNALVVERFDLARAEAHAADEKLARGESVGPLHGVPVTIKECLDVIGTASTFGLKNHLAHLAQHDDWAVARLRAAGAIILGKTNVAQSLLYPESDNPVYGRTNNPWNLLRTPGGSSGGEGAIIAVGGSPLGLGTDIGGSVRIPAAFSGIASFKPTAGRADDPGRLSVPAGQRAVVSQIGPMARRVEDLALTLGIINGANPEAVPPLGDYHSVDISKLRIGYYSFDGSLRVAPAVERAVNEAAVVLRKFGAEVVEWTPPAIAEAMHLYFALLTADGGAGLKRTWRGTACDARASLLPNLAGLPAPLRYLARALLGLIGQAKMAEMFNHFGYTRTDQYWTLIEQQQDYQARFAAAMDEAQLDVILCPPTALPAYTHGASKELGTGGAYPIVYNLLGYPAGVVPFTKVRPGEESKRPESKDWLEQAAAKVEHNSTGLPIAVQVVARPWRDHVSLAVMAALESSVRAWGEHFSPPSL